MPSKDKSAAAKTSRANEPRVKGGFVPGLCNVLGTLLILVVFALALPLSAPRFLGYQIYNVVSGSMEPAIPLGSVIYVRAVEPADVQVDEVIAFNDGPSVIAHRVVTNRTSLGEFVTKGDANNTEDLAPIPYADLIGVVALSVPYAGRFMAIYSTTVGKIYLVLTLACGVMLNILADTLRRQRSRKAALVLKERLAAGETMEEAQAAAAKVGGRGRSGAWLRFAIMGMLAIVFAGSAGVVAYRTHQYKVSDEKYSAASSQFTKKAESEKVVAPITVDFEALRSVNEDVEGWLYCEGTNLNYPVLHGATNDEYLRHDYTREYNINGSVFVDCDNAPNFADANTIVYGHHMEAGTMFGSLEDWASQAYYEEHPIMWLLTPTQDYQVILVSAHHVSAYSDMYEIMPEHNDDFTRWLMRTANESDFLVDESVKVDPEANYIMLTTCAYVFDNARYVIQGKLVPVASAGGVAL